MNPIKNGEIAQARNFAMYPVDKWLEAASEQFVKNVDRMMMEHEDAEEDRWEKTLGQGAPDLEKCFQEHETRWLRD